MSYNPRLSQVVTIRGTLNLNAIANTPLALPTRRPFSAYRVESLIFFDTSVDLSASLAEIRMGTTANGDEIASAQTLGILPPPDTNRLRTASLRAFLPTQFFTESPLHLSVPTAHGSAATVKYILQLNGLD